MVIEFLFENIGLIMSELIKVNAENPEPEIIQKACGFLEAGELIGVPTETVYGIACAPEHIEALYCAKERERGKPIARLAGSLEQVEALGADFGRDGKALAEKYWPGPLTLVLNTPEGMTGFRVPDHGVPLALARAFGRPIALTSANKSGEADALNAQEAFHCFQALENPVALYLESVQPLEKSETNVPMVEKEKLAATQFLPMVGKDEYLAAQLPSTVVQCLKNETKVLRAGAISAAEINNLL